MTDENIEPSYPQDTLCKYETLCRLYSYSSARSFEGEAKFTSDPFKTVKISLFWINFVKI